MNRISELRKQRGMTQKDLGYMFEDIKDSTTISKWERGVWSPNLESAFELSRIFGEPIEKIFPNMKTDRQAIKEGENETVSH